VRVCRQIRVLPEDGPARPEGGKLHRFLLEAVLRLSPAEVDPAQPLTALDLESLAAVELRGAVEADVGIELPLTGLLEGGGAAAVAVEILALLESATPAADLAPVAASEPAGEHPSPMARSLSWAAGRR
jgi:acyl carrier protein